MGGTLKLVPALLCAGALAACSQTDSKDIRTSGVTASIDVRASGDGADGIDVVARLDAGTLDTVKLTGDDALTVTAAGRTKQLGHRESFGQNEYRTHLDLDGFARPGLPVTVGLRRGAGDESAPRSVVRLPSPLSLTAPAAGSTQRRSSDLIVGTDSGNGTLRVEWSGSCVQRDSVQAFDGKPLIIPAGRMQAVGAAPSTSGGTAAPPSSCAVTLAVTRSVTGDLDEHYEGGSIDASRSASVAVRSVS